MRSLLSRPGLTSKTLRGKSERPTLGSRPEIDSAHRRSMSHHVARERNLTTPLVIQPLDCLFCSFALCSPDIVEGHVAHIF